MDNRGSSFLALIEWNRGGHHDTYLRVFAATLLRQGHRLLVLCRDPEELLESLSAECPAIDLERLRVVVVVDSEWIRERRRWPFGWAFRAYAAKIVREVRSVEKVWGGSAEIYFTCLYEHQVRVLHSVIKALGGRTWSGLYLHPHAFHHPHRRVPGVKRKWPVSRIWTLPGFRGLLMLDERIAPTVAEAAGRPVMALPDIADESTRRDDPLAVSLRKFAAGRPVVAVMGHLLPSKGVDVLARCALADETGEVVYGFAGEVHWSMFSEEDQRLLRLTGSSPNVWFHDGRIPDEAAYNAVFDSCDVIFAAYHDFPHSSNTLTKAALFEKPVLVTDGHLMAERVRRYQMGKVLSPDYSEATLAATVRELAPQVEEWKETNKPNWEGCRRDHSQERLAEVLLEFFPAGQQ